MTQNLEMQQIFNEFRKDFDTFKMIHPVLKSKPIPEKIITIKIPAITIKVNISSILRLIHKN